MENLIKADAGQKYFLSVRDLFVEYSMEGKVVHAVNGVSFDLEQGKTLALVGETGAGKTSIAKAILRVLPDPPAKVPNGQVYLDGANLLDLKENRMRTIRGNKISLIFQDPMTALNPVKRVGEHIAEGVRQHNKITRAAAFNRACDMLNMVGISDDRANDYPHQFSGGMKQRVVIAMALACSPKLLLADEPTTALDVTIQAQVLEMIKDLRAKLNTSMIMISHDLGVVAEVSDEVAVVYAGQIIEYGSRDAIFDNVSHPYTRGLFGALPDLEKDVRRLNPIEGLPPDPVNLPSGCSFHPRCPYADEECKKEPVPLREVEAGHVSRCLKPIPADRDPFLSTDNQNTKGRGNNNVGSH
jgi:peptide/nickel transport system ATP-binding protein